MRNEFKKFFEVRPLLLPLITVGLVGVGLTFSQNEIVKQIGGVVEEAVSIVMMAYMIATARRDLSSN